MIAWPCRREVPREQLLLIIRSFGGVVAWDGGGSPHAEADEAITHQARRCATSSSLSGSLNVPSSVTCVHDLCAQGEYQR